ncbi:transglycosylase [Hafnia paralvei]|nr:transglycosylase [Hafnia paralvei]
MFQITNQQNFNFARGVVFLVVRSAYLLNWLVGWINVFQTQTLF